MSKWIIPDRFFVAFSTGIFDPTVLRSYRKKISSDKRFYLTHKDKTIRDGLPICFTFDGEDFKMFRRDVREKVLQAGTLQPKARNTRQRSCL
jgi:hypothetical protein